VGARARYAHKFSADAFASWKEHDTKALETLRTDDNKAYCQLMAGLVPKNLVLDTGEPGPLDGMTADQLQELLETIRAFKAKTIDANAEWRG
jgi:hypothetical protein